MIGRLLDRLVGGHVTVGPITVYGRNAMHFAVNVRTRRGYLCFRLPLMCFGRWWPLYAYWSANATPWHHTVRGIGSEGGRVDGRDCVCEECFKSRSGRYRNAGDRADEAARRRAYA